MRLSEYLQETGTKPSAFAEKMGVAPSTVSRIINRDRSMSLDMAVKMSRATGGRVSIDDLIEEFSQDADRVSTAGAAGGLVAAPAFSSHDAGDAPVEAGPGEDTSSHPLPGPAVRAERAA